jgi:hypothetical protein
VQLIANPPAGSQTYQDVCKNTCGDRTVILAEAYTETSNRIQYPKTVCECANPIKTTKIVALNGTCKDTCTAECRTLEDLIDFTSSPLTVSCLTDAQCKTGIFKDYKGVTCKTQTKADGSLTNVCDVPVTGDNGKYNANLECSKYGGEGMLGASCSFVGKNDDLSSYMITRPSFSGTGSSLAYQAKKYDTSLTYKTVTALWTALDAETISNTSGLCFRYGLNEPDTSSIDVVGALATGAAEAVTVALGYPDAVTGADGSKGYVCMKKKTYYCGSVIINKEEKTPVVKNSFQYSCYETAGLKSAEKTSNCIQSASQYTADEKGLTVKKEDLCPGDDTDNVCCAFGCWTDSDCAYNKRCENGECVARVSCNPDDEEADTYKWRCRTASKQELVEQKDSDLFSGQSACLSQTSPSGDYYCQSSAQRCCQPVPTGAVGVCAADLGSYEYACYTPDELSSAGMKTFTESNTLGGEGTCITSDIQTGDNTSQKRCSKAGETCCHLSSSDTVLSERARSGAGCSKTDTNKVCRTPDSFVINGPEDTLEKYALQTAKFSSLSAYFNALSATGACEITQVIPGNHLNNYECVAGNICCSSNVYHCVKDDQCDSGYTCNPQLKLCLPSAEVGSAEVSCATQASLEDDPTYEDLEAVYPDIQTTFSCQSIPGEFADNENLILKTCLQNGCTDPGNVEEGNVYRCCAPGTGASSAATASTVPEAISATQKAEATQSTIGLSSCVRSGQCTLKDILVTGANFANFLIMISGAIFLAIIVYAGYKYLLAGEKGAEGGMKMIKDAMLGLALMFAGYLLISFIQSSFLSSVYETKDTCGATEATKNMQCMFISGTVEEAVKDNKCIKGLCASGPENYLCCPSVSSNAK